MLDLHYHPGPASPTSQFEALRYVKQTEFHHWFELVLGIAYLPMRK